MKVGYRYHTNYWQTPSAAGEMVAVAKQVESLGFDSIWTVEAYGADCLTPLAWIGSHTTSLRLGTDILQMAARTPTATAMAAMTLDHMSQGRVVLGLGASGPQVVEGWYGQPYAKPLARTREYIDVVRSVVRRQEPLSYQGDFLSIPLQGGTGLGKPLKSTLHPARPELPIMLAAEGPKNVALAGEVADGWLAMLFSPGMDDFYRAALTEGLARPGARHQSLDDFEVTAFLPVVIDDDTTAAADELRPWAALYIGGMGARSVNFHADVFRRMGHDEVVGQVQEAYLDGHKSVAAALVTDELLSEVALYGPIGKVREDLHKWSETIVSTVLVQAPPRMLPAISEAFADFRD